MHKYRHSYKKLVSDKILELKDDFNPEEPDVKALTDKLKAGEENEYEFLPIDWHNLVDFYRMKITIYSS